MMGAIRSWVSARMLHKAYNDASVVALFSSGIAGSGSWDLYNAFDAGGPLDNGAVK